PQTSDGRRRAVDFVEAGVHYARGRLVLRHQADERDYSCHPSRAGTPATTAPGATSRVTTAPAPTRACAPTRTPPSTTAPEPSEAPRSTTVRRSVQSSSSLRLPSSVVARGNRSLMKSTPCPTKTSSSISTPLQTNVWLEILQAST